MDMSLNLLSKNIFKKVDTCQRIKSRNILEDFKNYTK